MLKSQVTVGNEYAYRRTLEPGTPFRRVRAVSFSPRTRSKVRVEFTDGKDEDAWVTLGQLHGPWEEAEGRLADELRHVALCEESDAAWDPAVDEPVVKAVGSVLASTGECVAYDVRSTGREAGLVRIREPVFRRICSRSRVPATLADFGAHAYLDGDDWVHLPFGGALRLAKHFAAAKPDAVLDHLRGRRSEARAHPTLYSFEAGDGAAAAVARSWAEEARVPPVGGESAGLPAGYVDLLHRVRVLGAEESVRTAKARRLLQEAASVLAKRGASRLAAEIEQFVNTLTKAE